jgi:hypothetical protein
MQVGSSVSGSNLCTTQATSSPAHICSLMIEHGKSNATNCDLYALDVTLRVEPVMATESGEVAVMATRKDTT